MERHTQQIIIHVDMDAFYASVEIRDNPALKGKPLIIGSMPQERGVVATCSYEARKFGVRSGMNIKDAYRLCPHGIYMHPNFDKYKAASARLHEIWSEYASALQSIALDEAYLDVTETAGSFDRARQFAMEIKERTLRELRLTCSVGVAYSKTAAKTASEEKKPDGYFEILSPEDFVDLVIDRKVRVLYTVGEKTAEKLNMAGILTVRDIRENQKLVVQLLGKQGEMLNRLAFGIDDRPVTPYRAQDAKSIGREVTFQEDVDDFELVKDVLFLLALCVEHRAERVGLYGNGVSLKLTYADMKSISRSRGINTSRSAIVIYEEALKRLEQIEKRPIRLVGAGIYNLISEKGRQLTMEDFMEEMTSDRQIRYKEEMDRLQKKYGLDFAGNLEKIYKGEILHRTIEYMRKNHNQR